MILKSLIFVVPIVIFCFVCTFANGLEANSHDNIKTNDDIETIEHGYLPHSDYHQSQIVLKEGHQSYNSHQNSPLHVTEEILIPIPKGAIHKDISSVGQFKLDHSRPQQVVFKFVSPGARRKQDSGIPDLLAVLAPLAAIPLLGSLAVSSFTTMLTLTGMGRRRKRALDLHTDLLNKLNSANNQTFSLMDSFKFQNFSEQLNSYPGDGVEYPRPLETESTSNSSNTNQGAMSELFQLDIVQQYLRQSGRPNHNEEIIASYLACRGMFTNENHCLERLACHYADIQNGRLRPLERDVAALIIYSLLRNSHIDSSFKRRLQRAALYGHDHKSSLDEPSFVAACDRQFPCPKSEIP